MSLGRLVDDDGQLTPAAAAVLSPGVEVVVHCQSGARSARAQVLRAAAGRPGAVNLGGGIAAWMAAGHPVTTG